jgi:hypothetical protein
MRYTRKSLLLCLLVFSSAPLAPTASAQSATPSAADLENAKKSFATGVALLQDPDAPRYDEALLHFKRAYELSGSWKALGNLALCLFKLERDGEAIETYEKYLQTAGKKLDAGDRAQAERDLQALKAQVVTVELQLPEPGVALIDERLDATGRRVVNEYTAESTSLTLGLHPGRHTIVAKLSTGDVAWETRLDPATTVIHEFQAGQEQSEGKGALTSPTKEIEPTPPPEADRAATPLDLRIPAYASFGVAAVGVGVGVLFALKSKGSREQADAMCNGDQCPVSRRDQIRGLQDDANNQGRVAWIGFALGGVGAAAGVTLLVLQAQRAETGTRTGISPFVGFASAGVAGRF